VRLTKRIAGIIAAAPVRQVDFNLPCKRRWSKFRSRPTAGLPICMELDIVFSAGFHSS